MAVESSFVTNELANVTRHCDVVGCEAVELETDLFIHDNITCMKCKKFVCAECTLQIWQGRWHGEVFYKPRLVAPRFVHEIWRCPFCRDTFVLIEYDLSLIKLTAKAI